MDSDIATDDEALQDLAAVLDRIEVKAKTGEHCRLDGDQVRTLYQYLTSAIEVMAQNDQYMVFLEQELEKERNKKKKLWRPKG